MIVAAILAAGRGERLGADKATTPLRGRPLWKWSFDTFAAHPAIDAVGVVCSESNADEIRLAAPGAAFVAIGGSTRQESSLAALEALPAEADLVLIHDAARPFCTAELITRVVDAASRAGASAPIVPVTDTIRRVRGGTSQVIERGELYAMQTPQAGRSQDLLRGLRLIGNAGTDDLALLEAAGVRYELVPGEESNFKITTRHDLDRAKLMAGVGEVRTGMGFDAHAFSRDPARRLILGGVVFPGAPGLEGHSDADALLHAMVDALLGAASLGDIGEHFPPSEPQWKDCSSLQFLRAAGSLLCANGWRILNLDATVVAEAPRIMERAAEIRSVVAAELGLTVERVSVKATTNERMGFIGRGEGIACLAVATIAGG